MSNNEGKTERKNEHRTKRRNARYGADFTVSLTPKMGDRIRGASDRYGIASGAIIRIAIEKGLTDTLDQLRRDEKREQSN